MKTRNLFAIVAILLEVMSGCQDERYETIDSTKGVRVFAETAAPLTRVSFTEQGNITYATWDEGDQIGLYTDSQRNLGYSYSSSSEGVPEFTPLAEVLKDAEGKEVYAYYPLDGTDYNGVIPVHAGLRWGYDGFRPVLYAHGKVEQNELYLQFKHVFAYLKLTFTLEAFKSLTVDPILTQINLINDKDIIAIAGDVYLDIRTGKLSGQEDAFAQGTGTGIDNHDLRKGDCTLYVPVLPIEGGSVINIEVQAGGKKISFPRAVPEDGFKVGHIYTFNTSREDILELAEEQKQALIDFYNATNGNNWYRKDNWLSDKPIGEWFGVNNGDGSQQGDYVFKLDLSGNAMTGVLPESFACIMDHAQTIILHDNNLSGVIPQSIRSHPRWNKFGWNIIQQWAQYGGGFDMTDINLRMADEEVEYLEPSHGKTTAYELLKQHKLNYICIDTPSDAIINVHLSYHNKGFATIVAHQPWMADTWESTYERVKDHPITDIVRLWNSFGANDLSGLSKLGSIYLIDSEGYLVDFVCSNPNSTDEDRAARLANILSERLGEPEEHPIYSSEYYESTDFSHDGEVLTLQTATQGKGIDLVFMGDAYVDRDMAEGGKYEQDMKESMEYFFSIEPYKTFRNRFNVYAVRVVSTTEYIAEEKRKLAINFNNVKCFEYASKVQGIDLATVTIVNVVNNPNLFFVKGYTDMFDSGSSVAHIEVGGPSENIIHEAGGHGFAKLLDEYIIAGFENATATEEDKLGFAVAYTSRGWGANVDLTNSPTEIKWANFLDDLRYQNEVGIYEGANQWRYGAYRPSENSVMNQDYSWFNAPSREAIYKAIMRASEGDGWTYNFEDFASYDAINRNTARTQTRSAASKGKRKVIHKAPIIHSGPVPR